jgi:hypothetical protein
MANTNINTNAFTARISTIDAAGDLIAGILLDRIIYLLSPESDAKTERIERDGYTWIARRRADWKDEIRISAKQYDRAARILERKGFIVTKTFRLDGDPATHIRLNYDVLNSNFCDWSDRANVDLGSNSNGNNGGKTATEKVNNELANAETATTPSGVNAVTKRTVDVPERESYALPERAISPNGNNNNNNLNSNINLNKNINNIINKKFNNNYLNNNNKLNKFNNINNLNLNLNNNNNTDKASLEQQICQYTDYRPLKEALQNFIAMRERIDRPINVYGIKKVLQKLDDLSLCNEERAVGIVQQSINRQWLSFYPISQKAAQTVQSAWTAVKPAKAQPQEKAWNPAYGILV